MADAYGNVKVTVKDQRVFIGPYTTVDRDEYTIGKVYRRFARYPGNDDSGYYDTDQKGMNLWVDDVYFTPLGEYYVPTELEVDYV